MAQTQECWTCPVQPFGGGYGPASHPRQSSLVRTWDNASNGKVASEVLTPNLAEYL